MLYKSVVLLYKSAKFALWVAYVLGRSTAFNMAWIFSTLFRYSFYDSTASGNAKDEGAYVNLKQLFWIGFQLFNATVDSF